MVYTGLSVRESKYAKFRNFDIIKLSKSKGTIGMKTITAHSSQLTAHSSQLTAHTDYVIGCVFCQALKQAFSHFCEEAFCAPYESGVA